MSGLNHIGSKISLVSKAEIRYEGILYALDVPQQTISLAKVRSYGTEDRPTERPIPSKEEVYEFIIFRGTDIKNIDVLESPKQGSVLACGLPQDPAIIEVSHHRSSMAPFNCGFEQHSGRYPGHRGGRGEEPFEGLLMGPRGRRYSQENGNQSDRRRSSNNGPGRNYGGNNRNNGDMGRRSRQDNVYRGGGGAPRGRGNSPNRDRGQGNANGRDGSRGSSGNRAPNRQRGIIQAQMPPRVTFDEAFDFEKSNEELKTAMEKLKIKEERKEDGEKKEGEEDGENKEEKKEDPVIYYDKDKFFDNISCEALERARGGQPRQDWRAERKLNAETFGLVWKPNQIYQRNGQQRNYNRPRLSYGGYRGGNNPIRYNNRYNNRS